jgi:Co/Zn/Cd efflux system component
LVTNLSQIDGVKKLHNLHVWTLTAEKNACAAHLVIGK